MRKIIDFFIERSLLVNLLTFIIIFAGSVSIYSLQKEMFPQVEFEVILIRANYPGSSSEDVEKLVTLEIERTLKGIDGVKEINAMSAEGSSIIYIEVDPDANLKDVLDDVNMAIDSVQDLPEEVDRPTVRSLTNKRRGLLKVALNGDASYLEKRRVAKKLRDLLERDNRIAQVELDGYRKDEIRILVNPRKLNAFEVTLSEVSNAIRAQNVNLSAGKLETKYGDIIVRTLGELITVQDIEQVVVRSNDSGRKVYVSDVASVRRAPEEGTILQRANGKEAIFLDIKGKGSADVIGTTDFVKEKIVGFFKENKIENLNYVFVDDTSFYVKRRLNILKENGLLGLGLVFCCLLLFLNFKTSVVTSLGAPIAFMVAFIVMGYLGVSINLISMLALILVLGMLVDDSIIVSEHFYQKLEEGLPPKEAARVAAVETIKPVTATILTTVVSFGAIFFMGGIMGKFLWPVPAVVIICLIASWFECFMILPSHLADFCRLNKREKKTRWYDFILKSYEWSLRRLMKIPFLIVFFSFGILAGAIFVAKDMDKELFPGDDVRTVFIQMKGKVGTPLRDTNRAMMQLEEIAMANVAESERKQIKAQVGVLRGDQGNKTGSHYGSLVLYLTEPGERKRSTDEIIKSVSKVAKNQIKGFQVFVKKMQGGPPRGKAVEIELTGDSLKELKLASKVVERELKLIEGVATTEIDFEEGKKQLVIDVNQAQAKRLGLTTAMIASEFRKALAGDEITQIRESDEDIEIQVLLDDKFRENKRYLNELYISNNQGRRIPIKNVVTFKEKPGAFVIRRLDRKRIIAVSGTLNKALVKPPQVVAALKPKLKKVMSAFPDVDYVFAGENKDTKESMAGLMKSFGIATLCIFFILVAMFGSLAQPFVVMSAIPLGLVGVIIAFKIFGKTLGFMALLGVVALVGVVVNDSIVLVNFINIKRQSVSDLFEAVVQASVSRCRPVILTTFTTVAGLLPVAHAPGGDPFIKPMALSFAWGLLFATVVTLVFIPACYICYAKMHRIFVRVMNVFSGGSTHGGEQSGTT